MMDALAAEPTAHIGAIQDLIKQTRCDKTVTMTSNVCNEPLDFWDEN